MIVLAIILVVGLILLCVYSINKKVTERNIEITPIIDKDDMNSNEYNSGHIEFDVDNWL